MGHNIRDGYNAGHVDHEEDANIEHNRVEKVIGKGFGYVVSFGQGC